VGDWKLVCDHKKPFELYNIKKDRAELHNLASKYPKKVEQLTQKWDYILNEFLAQATKDIK
jgi:arylsulfatase